MKFKELKKLFQDIYLLNRTHNSDDLVNSIKIIKNFMKNKKFRGIFRVIEYPASKNLIIGKFPKGGK